MLNDLIQRLEILEAQYKTILVFYEANYQDPTAALKVKKIKDWIDLTKAKIHQATISEVPTMTGTGDSWKPGAW